MKALQWDSKRTNTLAWAIAIAFFAAFSYCIPRLVDDWAFLGWYREALSGAGLFAKLKELYEALNGRILGNGLLLVLTGSKLVRTLYKILIFSALFWCMGRFSGLDRGVRGGMACVFLCMLLTPFSIRRETYAWDAGFINYLTPMALLFAYLLLIRPLLSHERIRDSVWRAALCFLIGLCEPLFVENMAFYALVMALAAVVWHKVATRRFSACTICFLLGAAAGCVVLFGSPAYGATLSGADGYRAVPATLPALLGLVKSNYPVLSLFSLESYTPLQLVISSCAIGLLLRADGLSAPLERLRKVLIPLLAALPLYFYLMSRTIDIEGYHADSFVSLTQILGAYPAIALDALLYALYVASAACIFLFFVREKSSRMLGLFCIASALIIAAPMLVVQPVGPRCFFGSFLFWALAALLLVRERLGYAPPESPALATLGRVATAAMLALSVCTVGLYSTCPKVEKMRCDYLEQQMRIEAPVIVLPEFDCESYLHYPTAMIGDAYYYRAPGDIEIPFIPRAEWMESFSSGLSEEELAEYEATH